MRLLLMASALVLLTGADRAFGQASSDTAAVLRKYLVLRDGSRGSSDGEEVARAKARFSSTLGRLLPEFSRNEISEPAPCKRYLLLSTRLTEKICEELASLSLSIWDLRAQNSETFLKLVRIQVLMSAFTELEALFEAGSEGGFSLIDARQHQACPFPIRDELHLAFTDAFAAARVFFRTAFGTEGVTKAREVESRLLGFIQTQSESEHRTYNAFLLGSAVASIWIWDMVPVSILAVRALWGASRFTGFPAAVAGSRFALLSGEGALFWSLPDGRPRGSPEVESPLVNATWESQMEDMESLIDASWSDAEREWRLVTRIHAQVLMPSWLWLQAAQPQLEAAEKKEGSVDKTFWPSVGESRFLLEEMAATAGLSVEEQTAWYIERLRALGMHVKCDDSIRSGVTEWQCLIGLRTFLDYAASERQSQLDETVQITIAARGDWDRYRPGAIEPEAMIPWQTTVDELTRFFSNQFSKNDFFVREVMRSRMQSLSKKIEEATGLKVEVDPSITLSQVALGLGTLDLLPAFQVRRIECLRIGSSFRELYESHQKICVTIRADAPADAIVEFIHNADSRQWVQPGRVDIAEFDRLRAEEASLEDFVSQSRMTGKFVCSSTESLTTLKCVKALRGLKDFIARGKFRPVDVIIAVSMEESPRPIDLFTDEQRQKKILVIREDATETDLADSFRKEEP